MATRINTSSRRRILTRVLAISVSLYAALAAAQRTPDQGAGDPYRVERSAGTLDASTDRAITNERDGEFLDFAQSLPLYTVPETVEDMAMIGTGAAVAAMQASAAAAAGAGAVAGSVISAPVAAGAALAYGGAQATMVVFDAASVGVDRANNRMEQGLYVVGNLGGEMQRLVMDRQSGHITEKEFRYSFDSLQKRFEGEIQAFGAAGRTKATFLANAFMGTDDSGTLWREAVVAGQSFAGGVLRRFMGRRVSATFGRWVLREGEPWTQSTVARAVKRQIGSQVWHDWLRQPRFDILWAGAAAGSRETMDALIGRVRLVEIGEDIQLVRERVTARSPTPTLREVEIPASNAFQGIVAIQQLQAAAAVSRQVPASVSAPLPSFAVIASVQTVRGYSASSSHVFSVSTGRAYSQAEAQLGALRSRLR
jgi:hypothetical protein